MTSKDHPLNLVAEFAKSPNQHFGIFTHDFMGTQYFDLALYDPHQVDGTDFRPMKMLTFGMNYADRFLDMVKKFERYHEGKRKEAER